MATGIHDYEQSTQIHTMVTAYSLNDIVEAEIKIHFNLSRFFLDSTVVKRRHTDSPINEHNSTTFAVW